MKMKKINYSLMPLNYIECRLEEKDCCETYEIGGLCIQSCYDSQKSLLKRVVILLGVHRGNDEFLKLFGDRDQGVVDHDILGVDGIYMVYIHNV